LMVNYLRRRTKAPAAREPKPSRPSSGSGEAVCGRFWPDLDWFEFVLFWPEVAFWSVEVVLWSVVVAGAALWLDDGVALLFTSLPVVEVVDCVLVVDWSVVLVEDGVVAVEDGVVLVWSALLVVDDGVVVVEDEDVELCGVVVAPALPLTPLCELVVSVLVVPVVEVAAPVVPPVVEVVEDWFMSVPVAPVGVLLGLVVPAVPVVVSVLVAGVVVDGLEVVLVEDWLFCSPAPLFWASGDWLPVTVALPPALVLWMSFCFAWFGSTGWALAGTCWFWAFGSTVGELVCELVAWAFGSVVDVLELVCA
jgi:hypothetical protein